MPGVGPDQVVEVLNCVYGLVDGPAHWRGSLILVLKSLNYKQSRLDPCIFKLYHMGRLEGVVAIEVDDLFVCGHEVHLEKMRQLRERFKFGKWVSLQEEADGAAFNGGRIKQKQDGSFEVDMQKFVEERLQEVPLEKGRLKDRKAAASLEEISGARAVCGALNWLSKEGRPDVAGVASLLASRLKKLTVDDVANINDVVKRTKEKAGVCLKIQALRNMKMGVVTDASFANRDYHSQGGQVIIAYEDSLQDGMEVRVGGKTAEGGFSLGRRDLESLSRPG
ncbi:unnamed protein product [Effrenium voratum]|uniref:Uncharacterized protein n=1 Tax=Effrenium voratum TaxID=2562239 RepID=A0AA36J6T0_9DINO|nr:unnamed protein product [Effrenium voratum]